MSWHLYLYMCMCMYTYVYNFVGDKLAIFLTEVGYAFGRPR